MHFWLDNYMSTLGVESPRMGKRQLKNGVVFLEGGVCKPELVVIEAR